MRTLARTLRAPACCRSTRSTSCSARTTCRCTHGWAPTTSTCCPGVRRAPRRLVEYWAHVRRYMPVDLWPQMRHRMGRTAPGDKWGARGHRRAGRGRCWRRSASAAPDPRDLDDGLPRDKEHWGWNWSETQRALEYLFLVGELAVAGRNSQFERLYDLPERVLPAAVLGGPSPTVEEAHRELVRRAASSHGVGTERAWRLLPDASPADDAYRPLARRASSRTGELVPVAVEGSNRPAYLHRDARRPRRSTPARCSARSTRWSGIASAPSTSSTSTTASRSTRRRRSASHGYYVLPFLLGDQIVGRVDLKADRKTGRAAGQGRVRRAAAPRTETAEELAAELRPAGRLAGSRRRRRRARGDLAPACAGSEARPRSRPRRWLAPGIARIAAPSRAAAARCGPSASSPAMTGASSSAVAFFAHQSPGAGCLDRLGDHRLVKHRVHRHQHQRQVVRQGPHRGGVTAVPDHQRRRAASARRVARSGGLRRRPAAAGRPGR